MQGGPTALGGEALAEVALLGGREEGGLGLLGEQDGLADGQRHPHVDGPVAYVQRVGGVVVVDYLVPLDAGDLAGVVRSEGPGSGHINSSSVGTVISVQTVGGSMGLSHPDALKSAAAVTGATDGSNTPPAIHSGPNVDTDEVRPSDQAILWAPKVGDGS